MTSQYLKSRINLPFAFVAEDMALAFKNKCLIKNHNKLDKLILKTCLITIGIGMGIGICIWGCGQGICICGYIKNNKILLDRIKLRHKTEFGPGQPVAANPSFRLNSTY